MKNIQKIAQEILAASTISDTEFLSTLKAFMKKYKNEVPGVERMSKIYQVKNDIENPKTGRYDLPSQQLEIQIGYGSTTTFFDTTDKNKKGWFTWADDKRGGKPFKDSTDLMNWLETFYKSRKK